MDNASKIKQLLQQITGTEQSVFLFRPMEVVSVEGDTCRARYNEPEIPGIRLAAIEGGADGGLLLKPATGSIVLVADLSCGELRECSVIGYSEIEALTYRHGDTTVTMNGSNVSATAGSRAAWYWPLRCAVRWKAFSATAKRCGRPSLPD